MGSQRDTTQRTRTHIPGYCTWKSLVYDALTCLSCLLQEDVSLIRAGSWGVPISRIGITCTQNWAWPSRGLHWLEGSLRSRRGPSRGRLSRVLVLPSSGAGSPSHPAFSRPSVDLFNRPPPVTTRAHLFFFFLTLHNCISFAKYQNESDQGTSWWDNRGGDNGLLSPGIVPPGWIPSG